MTVRQAMVLLVVGLVVGLALGYASMPLITPVLVGVSAKDPLTFAAVAGLLAFVALFASYVPARHTASVDPIGG